MRILHTVEKYLPERNGMQEVVTQLSERLVSLGHEVVIATSADERREEKTINGVRIVEFNISGNTIEGFSGETKEYSKFLQNADFDIITNFAAQQWATDLALPLLKDLNAKTVFVPTGFSALGHPLYKEYYERMGEWMNEYDMCVFLSDDYRDINFARTRGLKKYVIIPNGASLEEFAGGAIDDIRAKLGIRKDAFLVLHVGSFTGVKGHYQAIQVFKKAVLSNAVLLLAGNTPKRPLSVKIKNLLKFLSFGLLGVFPSGNLYYKISALINNLWLPNVLRRKRIKVVHLPRKDIVSAYKSADLFLFPSMIECSPIVLFESMAAQTPFLVTDVGNSKEIIAWTQAGELMPTFFDKNGYSLAITDRSAESMTAIYQDKERRAKLAENGYKAITTRFNWQQLALEYEGLYKAITKQKPT